MVNIKTPFECLYIPLVPKVGGGGDDNADNKEEQAEQERLRQEAIKQTERERREKYKKQEEEREIVRQAIREKVNRMKIDNPVKKTELVAVRTRKAKGQFR